MDGLLQLLRRGAVWPAAVTVLVLVGAPVVADSFPGPGSGPVPDPHTGPTTARIGLSGFDPEGLRKFATAVSDPRNAEYRHFLTPAQVKARFGPTPQQVKKVHDWVAAAGLKGTRSAALRRPRRCSPRSRPTRRRRPAGRSASRIRRCISGPAPGS